VLELEIARRCEGFDIAPQAVEVARELANSCGLSNRVRYWVADANTALLERGHYDAVLSDMSLHHVSRLEHFFEQIASALRPEGLLIFREFVGPTRFQWTDRQLERANQLLRSLPRRYRRNLDPVAWKRWLRPFRRRVRRWSPEKVAAMDPSESVRSGELMSACSRFLEWVEIKPFGGTVLHLVLDKIAGNFRDTPRDVEVLLRLCRQEKAWIDSGELQCDHVVAVARPRNQHL
jgi:SAM-dependent methyltransferase